MFNFIKKKLTGIYQHITWQLNTLFNRSTVDAQTLSELRTMLLSADTGSQTTDHIMNLLETTWQQGTLTQGSDLKYELKKNLLFLLQQPQPMEPSNIYVLVGINGSGKTTLAAKLAYLHKQAGKKVLLVAADTFRAAAQEQLATWAKQLDVDIFIDTKTTDPAAVVFAGCKHFKEGNYDVLIIDTAGRLQTKINLMKELAKIKQVLSKQLPNQQNNTLLTIDALLGQNSLDQAQLFHESTHLNGIVLTKMDSSAKGGIVFAITQKLNIPIVYASYGEKAENILLFDPNEFVDALLS